MKFARLLITSLFVVILLIGSTYFGIIRRYNGKFDDSWQHMIQLKYKRLASADSPRIIVIAGSSAAFGLDQKMIEEETALRFAILVYRQVLVLCICVSLQKRMFVKVM